MKVDEPAVSLECVSTLDDYDHGQDDGNSVWNPTSALSFSLLGVPLKKENSPSSIH